MMERNSIVDLFEKNYRYILDYFEISNLSYTFLEMGQNLSYTGCIYIWYKL